ncbi:MAG: hypothetical protein E6I76_00230 [Chloroflexi bacterium]|nr:MAG: hypothetical protein E6I76_00230 [Chloroflexota bacterium]
MKLHRLLIPAALLGAAAFVTGCGGVSVPPLYQPAVAAAPVHVTWVIATPAMLGSDEKPAYLPGNPVLPANTDVTVTVVNFDDATVLPAGTETFATPTGIVGGLSVAPMDPANPNADTPAKTVASLDPATGVSHTFTVAKLNLNVPIAPKSRTTFTFHTGAAGTYAWQCMDPCGTDPAGWGGAMAATGYMKGTLTIA